MNEVRTFRAKSMHEALQLVREELGADAVILHTRQVELRRRLPWSKPRHEVEITAGVGVNVRPLAARQGQSQAEPPAGRALTEQASRAAARSASMGDQPPAPEYVRSRRDETLARQALPPQSTNRIAGAPLTQTTQLETYAAARQSQQRPQRRANVEDPSAALAAKLDSIQRMLEQLGRTAQAGRSDDIPTELFQLYTDLIEAEVEEDIAREFIGKLKQNCSPAELRDAGATKALLTAMVESEMTCCGPIAPVPGRRKVVALIGATGVGKTTTIAKLAANFRLRHGIKMGLVTVDTYRIAAVEQLRTYAEIIDLPMKVVTSPPEMRRALDELQGLDLVLIDTAGRSPRDELKIQELKSLLNEAQVDAVHLVLSLTSSARSLQATAELFKAVNPTCVILTKLDEAASSGALLSIARKIRLPISYITTGQNVPDDIEVADSGRLARLALGQEQLCV
jgi:flagellar biosynthesis protein FlhF